VEAKSVTERLTVEQIREYWRQQAQQYGQSPSSSWSDHSVIEMEIRNISQWLKEGDRVLDVGCANGYSTVRFAAEQKIDIRGVDYIPEMIEIARQRLKEIEIGLPSIVHFGIGDITSLNETAGFYDKVIVTRVIINLGEWSFQLKGLHECCRVLKQGGLLLLSEATLQGWQKMNQFRREWGLIDIPMPAFNLYLDRDKVVEEMSNKLELIELSNFSSTYYVGTRILKPLIVKVLGSDVNVANPDMEWNRWFSELPSWGDYGTQNLFVFRKR
jgi:ubiquinone/menaquinone biosynthesis C-methylase UbiE